MAIQWKRNKILSIETRTGLYVLARMLEEPYLLFYNKFKTEQIWGESDFVNTPVLFCTAVAREFLNSSNIVVQKKIKNEEYGKANRYWIHSSNVYRTIKLWEGTKNEIVFSAMGHGGKLIEDDPYNPKGVGENEKIIQFEIDFSDNETIDKYDLDYILFYPNLNERLYLCYKWGKNIDPLKDIVFDREIPLDYEVYFRLYAGEMTEEDWLMLPL